jgi:hypothetical protein
MRIRGGSGLGDSIYLRPIAEHFVRAGKRVAVKTFYPDVFIGSGVSIETFDKKSVDVVAHYAAYRKDQQSTQFADMLRCAKIGADVPLRFDWPVRNRRLVADLLEAAEGYPIVLVHGGRPPFGRTDGVGREILPRREAFETVLGAFADCYTVRIGKGEQIYRLPADLDLVDKTSVSDLLDIATVCTGMVTQCGFPIPMAECFDKPVLAVWSARGLVSVQPIVGLVTPAKILSKATSRHVMDDAPREELLRSAWAFRNSLQAPAELAA